MKLIETNSDGRYCYEGVQVKAEPTPSAERVKEAIRMLEIGWWEGTWMRAYYAWRRFAQAWKKYQLGRVLWISGTVLAVVWVAWVLAAAVIDWLLSGLGAR